MLLQYLQLTERLMKEIRLKERRAVVISATFLAAGSGAALTSAPATVTAGIYGFVASGAAPARVLDAKGEQRVLGKKSQIWGWIREILLLVTLVTAAQSCLDKAEGDGEELNDSDCASNDTGKCSRGILSWHSLLQNVRFMRFCGVQLSFYFVV